MPTPANPIEFRVGDIVMPSALPIQTVLSQLKRQLNRVVLSSEDFQEARGYFAESGGSQHQLIQRGLLTAAIVAYVRPFVPARTEASEKMTSQLKVKLREVFTPDEITQHKSLLGLRHEVVAHTGYGLKPVSRFEGTVSHFSVDVHHFDLLEQSVDTGRAARMCEKLQAYCFQQGMALNQLIVQAEQKSPADTLLPGTIAASSAQ
jgi:hypothetical protein